MIWHYLVGVRMVGINSSTPGKKSMDFMIEWKGKDVEAARIAKGMTENYFWKTSNKEAIQTTGLSGMASSLYCAHIRARVNDLLLLRYDTEFKMEEDDMAIYVENTPLEKLVEAKVPIRG